VGQGKRRFRADKKSAADTLSCGSGQEHLIESPATECGQDYPDKDDVDMPLLNGMELFRKAVRFNPELKDRFVF